MYINKVFIQNIRSISDMEIQWESGNEPGWHVIIGDNGAGKSTVVRSISLALLGMKNALASQEEWNNWLKKQEKKGSIKLFINYDSLDERSGAGRKGDAIIANEVQFERNDSSVEIEFVPSIKIDKKSTPDANSYNWGTKKGWFSAAYGPFRRFLGGNPQKDRLFTSYPKLGAHLSIFGEDVALSEAIPFIRELYIDKLERQQKSLNQSDTKTLLDIIIDFVNTSGLLPHETTISDINKDFVLFKDGNKEIVDATQMSDGFRSVLSLTFELIRQLKISFSEETVIENYVNGSFNLSGVVLIDEIDVHLHPSWQAVIGKWFTRCFPKLQFIVTTHNPIICRACGKTGIIFRLAKPGAQQKSSKIEGIARKRLIYGNVLDAYGTEAFGQSVEINTDSQEMRKRKVELQNKSYECELTQEEEKELYDLQATFPTKK